MNSRLLPIEPDPSAPVSHSGADDVLRVQILLFDDVEVLDFAGPYEVFTTATRVAARAMVASQRTFSVACVSRDGGTVRARAGLRVQADHGFEDAPPCDLLLVPGGVVDAPLECPRTVEWIARQSAQAQWSASVCTGAFLLARAGVLPPGARVTTHWEDVPDLQARFPTLQVLPQRRWVDLGRVLSSGGISAGIDMSLHLVARLAGRELAQATARQMDYRWHEDDAG